jgi:hypothetical protein
LFKEENSKHSGKLKRTSNGDVKGRFGSGYGEQQQQQYRREWEVLL